MSLRPARPEDAAQIATITNAIIRDTLVTFTTREREATEIASEIDARGERFQIAERAGQVVGFCTYGPFRGGPGYRFCAEHSIQLAPEARGLGLGRALMGRIETVARDDGLHVLIGAVSGANPAGIGFHAALGYQQVGVMPQVGFKAGQWLDLVLMQKILAKG